MTVCVGFLRAGSHCTLATYLAVKEPANKIGSDEIGVLPLSQGDLLGEMRQ